MSPKTQPTPSDAELVAYLDGELSPADSVRIGQQVAADGKLSGRLEALMKGGRPFSDAFAPLLEQAPVEKLDAMLAALVERSHRVESAFALPKRFWATALVGGLAMMAAGAGLDRLAASRVGPSLLASDTKDEDGEGWRSAVTQYLSLYTSETLSTVPDSEEVRRQELAGVGGRLGLDLNEARVAIPGLTFKRAEMFDYDGRPLGFLAYLDPRAGPVSVCIIAGAGGDAPPRVERRRGMTVVYWSRSGHGFMLIGRGNSEDLLARANLVASQFDGTADGPPSGHRG